MCARSGQLYKKARLVHPKLIIASVPVVEFVPGRVWHFNVQIVKKRSCLKSVHVVHIFAPQEKSSTGGLNMTTS
ncbi:MAG: hypothetical protein A2X13_12330 [Bacteroidetes bacterium GWC2_33_15]|nr:MAG: hypothetical protein A2X10_14365 [Bacteroidetes bacterium GWA2_33_15]OFX50579.1 MAG: hypothetical protein A2X13_12330 [Bacteroidetes bacterium GWC2_33_15]OFX64116.1 MAG: hypothetical protein A2X15_02780 [Bacteroidetes bacterium GWB2_32_14]OFX69728.1 MAG: hypothetical protein A2X14_05005 [Bacteroidetes bacterium GWD2_33_33]